MRSLTSSGATRLASAGSSLRLRRTSATPADHSPAHQRRYLVGDSGEAILGVYALESQAQMDAAVKGNPSLLFRNQPPGAAEGQPTRQQEVPEFYYKDPTRRVGVDGRELLAVNGKTWSGFMPPGVRPATWNFVPAGWCMLVESERAAQVHTRVASSSLLTTPASGEFSSTAGEGSLPAPLPVQKTFSFKSQNAMYLWLGKVAWFASTVEVVPTFDWMCSECTVTLRPLLSAEKDMLATASSGILRSDSANCDGDSSSPSAAAVSRSQLVAEYMNDVESDLGVVGGNMSSATSKSEKQWDPNLDANATLHARENFVWINEKRAATFSQETGMQWGNRADYLVSRYSRQKKEFRKDLSLGKVIQEGQERRRRMERKKIKEVKREAVKQSLDLPEGFDEKELDSFSFEDTIPRELREEMDHDTFSQDPYTSKPKGLAGGEGQLSHIFPSR